MKVIAKCVRKIYKFRCPFCGSLLETENEKEVDTILLSEELFKYYCPVCGLDRFTSVKEVEVNYVYEKLYNRRRHPS